VLFDGFAGKKVASHNQAASLQALQGTGECSAITSCPAATMASDSQDGNTRLFGSKTGFQGLAASLLGDEHEAEHAL
jgi:hypothetical protein